MDISVGKRVQHSFTKEPLYVLRVGNEQILCRTKDLREIWFYPHELEEVDGLREDRKLTSRFL